MATTPIFSLSDVMSHLYDWCNVTSSDAVTSRKIKRAVASAYREFFESRTWAYLMDRGRISTVANYTTGTIAYTNSTRAVTLTSGTWPSWAGLGRIIMGNPALEFPVVSRDSDSQITLDVNSNPGADVAAGTSYNLWQDEYPLPVNCQSVGALKDSYRNVVLDYIEPNNWVKDRPYSAVAGVPRVFTITGERSYLGALGIRIMPPPNAVYNFDFMYKRMPRQMTCNQYTTGTVTTSTTTVTGTSTVFTSAMVGCLIRFSSGGTAPTGLEGSNPYVAQRVITAFTSATSITIDQALSSELAGVKFEISDPIEMEANAMYTAFLRRCESDLGPLMRRDDQEKLRERAHDAWLTACEQDNRTLDSRPSGPHSFQRVPTYFTITNATT